MSRCQTCAVDGHDTCWDVKPDRSCPCCLDTWFNMLVTPTKEEEDDWHYRYKLDLGAGQGW